MKPDVERNLAQFGADVESAAGPALLSIVLYGSGAAGEHVPGKSDLNLLVVVKEVTLPFLSHLQEKVARWNKAGISTPLVVDGDFLPTSTDSYPLEILGMLSAHRIVRGGDPFEQLRVDPRDARLQAEREIKAKRLLMRRGYLESQGKEAHLRRVLIAAVPAVEAIFRGMLFVRGGDWRAQGAAFRASCAGGLGIDSTTLERLRSLRAGRIRPNREVVLDLYARTVGMLDALAKKIENGSATA